MKVLVTGGAGFIGRNLVDRLRSYGHKVLVLDKAPAGQNNQFGSNDIIDLRNWVDFGENEPYDVVYHLAAYVSASKSLEEPDQCYNTNIKGTLNLIDKFNFKRIVFASSAAVYGSRMCPTDGFIENIDMAPLTHLLTPYAKTKLMGEQIIHDLCPSYANLRFFNVYGDNQNPEYGAVIQSFVDCSRNGKPYKIYGDGEQIRDFIHVRDVINALLFSGEGIDTNFCANVGTGVGTSVNELQQLISKDGEVVRHESRDGDPLHSVANIHKLKYLGWSPKIQLSSGIFGLL